MNPAPPTFDPAQIAIQVAMALIQALAGQIQMVYQQIIAWANGQQFLFQTGASVSYQQPVVMQLWRANVLIADSALALVILWIGYHVILAIYDPLQMLSRVVLAAVAIHASLQFIGLFIRLNNALCVGVLGTTAPTISDIAAFLNIPAATGNGFVVVGTTIINLMSIVVLLQELVRLGLLDLLIAFIPFAALLYISPATQHWANLIFTAFFAVLFLQFAQVSAIVIGAALITSINSTFSIVSALAGIAVLFFVLKIPGWLGSAVTGAIGGVGSPFAYAAQAAREAAQGVLTLIRIVP
jgi:hypothetical protein